MVHLMAQLYSHTKQAKGKAREMKKDPNDQFFIITAIGYLCLTLRTLRFLLGVWDQIILKKYEEESAQDLLDFRKTEFNHCQNKHQEFWCEPFPIL